LNSARANAATSSLIPLLLIVIMRVLEARTGPVSQLSTSRFSVVATTSLSVAQLYPVVAQHKLNLASKRHGLTEVG
jgi:hypothetical protein